MTLAEFIRRAEMDRSVGFPRRAFVQEPGFNELYVRHALHYIDGERLRCIDIARVEAKEPGQGTFKALIDRLRTEYPLFTIYVECVHEERFREGLLRMGFLVVPNSLDQCYYMRGTK